MKTTEKVKNCNLATPFHCSFLAFGTIHTANTFLSCKSHIEMALQVTWELPSLVNWEIPV